MKNVELTEKEFKTIRQLIFDERSHSTGVLREGGNTKEAKKYHLDRLNMFSELLKKF